MPDEIRVAWFSSEHRARLTDSELPVDTGFYLEVLEPEISGGVQIEKYGGLMVWVQHADDMDGHFEPYVGSPSDYSATIQEGLDSERRLDG